MAEAGVGADVDSGDADRDSLHTLPLSIAPLEIAGLRRMRVIKNVRMEGVVEVFAGDATGSGLVAPDQLYRMYDLGGRRHADIETIKSLSVLPSYDVYSLRLELRRIGIDVDQHEHLRLSTAKAAELADYMRDFTRPLLKAVYGEGVQQVTDLSDLMKLFLDPDVERARKNLNRLSKALGIGLADIPKFLDDYGDVYLSLAYYTDCLNQIEPQTGAFLTALGEIRGDRQCRNDRRLMRACAQIEARLKSCQASTAAILGAFQARTEDMWDDISATSFREVRDLITGCQVRIGTSLCALTVKMNAWFSMFPALTTGSVSERTKFIMNDMMQGLEYLQDAPLSDRV